MEKSKKTEQEMIQYPHLEQTDIHDALNQLGFKLNDRGAYWQTSAIWRNGDNPTAIQIYKDSGVWCDFVEQGKHQPFSRLVGKVLGTSDKKQIEKYIKVDGIHLDFVEEKDNRVKISMDHIYDITDLKKLLPHHKFYLDRNISLDVLKMYQGGYATAGKMNGRYTFPIFQEKIKENIIGYTGRSPRHTKDSPFPKWKHIGQRKNWIYPLYIPVKGKYPFLKDAEDKKEIIIVESIGDSLALSENKFLNHMVTFGLSLSSKQICQLVSLNPSTITIAANNDHNKEINIGLEAAIKNFVRLMDFFDISKLCIKLPETNDLSDLHVSNRFDCWATKNVNREKQLNFILKKLESREGLRIIPNKKKLQAKIKFLQQYLEE